METKQATPKPPRNSGLGMTMNGKVIVELRRLALGARPNLTPVFQQKHKRWMIAGEEGGGCTGEIGHYIGFAGVTPEGLTVSIPIQSLIPNSTQRQSYLPRDDTGSTLPLWQLLRFIGDAPLRWPPPPKRERDRVWSAGFYSRETNGILAPGYEATRIL
jgi:hypothetical protein